MKDPKGHGSNGRGGKKIVRPIPGHSYHSKSTDELKFISKDAHEAARAMRGWNSGAESKYLDQVNDAQSVLGYRERGGTSDHPWDKAANELHSGTKKSDPVPTHAAMQWGEDGVPVDYSHDSMKG